MPEELGNLENLESMYWSHARSWHLRCITTFEDERARAGREREARIEEREARAASEVEHSAERETKLWAEARIRELEEENRRLRGG